MIMIGDKYMSEVRDYARECGVRCRQIRMSKGMSQQQLAEKMNVTSAAVSKWEKEGISNIDHIKKISDVLGQDITADQLDQEGSIGEIGKEILRELVTFDGNLSADWLFDSLYGMKKDRICNELFKLERIGTIVREQFKDFSGEDRDVVFITAKGLIAYKNFESNLEVDLDNVKTWDQILKKGETSVQEVVDNDVTTQFILNDFNYLNSFRFDYLTNLHFNKMNLFVPHEVMRKQNNFWWEVQDALLCGESCYIDVLRRMAQATNRAELDEILLKTPDLAGEAYYDKQYEMEVEATGIDEYAEEALNYFKGKSRYLNVELSDEDKRKQAEKNKNDMKDLREWQYACIDELYVLQSKENKFYESLSFEQKQNVNKWFSYEEIYDFVDKNILPPKTDYERYVNEQLKKMWEYDPTTLNYYYSFTEAWEKNGLAQFIRDRVGIPKIYNEKDISFIK